MKKDMNTNKNKAAVIAAFAAILLITIVTILISRNNYPIYVTLPTEDMTGVMTWREDGIWYVDENTADSGIVLYGPYMYMEKGDYTIQVDYECDYDNYVDINANGYTEYVLSGDVLLSHLSTQKTFDIRTREDIDNFEIRIQYEGDGYIRINAITIFRNAAGFARAAFILSCCILLMLICYLKKEALAAESDRILWILFIAVLATAPLFAEGFCYGHDGRFHLLRIDGIAQELRNGQFPVRMESLWMEGYGYPVSIYYGDLLLYFPAILRMIGFSISEAYKSYVFAVNLATAAAAQLCFEKISGNRKAAGIGAAAYTLATYRLVNIYVRTAVGEYTALIFLPIILLAVYNMYTDRESPRKNAFLLAIGMTGLIQTHIISVAMTVILLAVFAAAMFRKTFTKGTIVTYLRAVIMTIGLNLFFLVPFVDYYFNVPVQVTAKDGEKFADLIEHKGAYLSQYFMLYQTAAGGAKENVGDRMGLTPGIVLMLALIAAIYVCIRNTDRLLRILTVMSLLSLFMASNLFPWNDIIKHVPFMGWIADIQFPFRFISLALPLMSLLLCRLLTLCAPKPQMPVYPVMAVVVAAVTFQQCTAMIQDRPYTMIYDTAQIDSFSIGNGEYLREGTNVDIFDGQVCGKNLSWIMNYVRKGTYMELRCANNDSVRAWVDFPVLNYPGYVAEDWYGNRLETADGPNNVLRVFVPAEFSGWITVRYVSPWYYRLADISSLLIALYLVLRIVRHPTSRLPIAPQKEL